MSVHPNVILLCALKPEDLARKTLRAIRSFMSVDENDDDADLKIGGEDYHVKLMETDYDDDWQIGSDEGDILVFDLVTYGYGEKIAWDALAERKSALEAWAGDICQRFHCSYSIHVTANYW